MLRIPEKPSIIIMATLQKDQAGDYRDYRDYLLVFQEVTRLISNVHDPQQVMDLVVRRLPELLGVDAATIRLLDQGTNSFILGAARGVSEEYLSRRIIDCDEVMDALLEGKPIASSDVGSLCNHESRTVISQEGVKSVLSLPVLYKQQVVGLLRLLTKEKRNFSQSEMSFSMSLAEQVGLAIVNSRMVQELENQIRFYEGQRHISQLVNSTLDLDEILGAIVDKIPDLFDVSGCTIRLLHPATNRLELVASSGLSGEYLGRGSVRREDSIFKALKGEPVAVYDAPNDSRVEYHDAIRAEGIKSILAIPIENNKEIIGVLRLLTTTHRAFSPSEINFARTVAEEGGNAIEKARTYRKITLLFNQIEEHERLLQIILDAMWMQLIVVDTSKTVIMANRQFLNMRAVAEGEIVGRAYQEIFPDTAYDKGDGSEIPQGFESRIDQVLGGESELTEIRKREAGATTVCFEHHFKPILDADGKVQFVIEAVRDITDQFHLEEEKMQRVKLEGVVEMAGTAAHELNTPLFAALGTAELLREDLADVTSGDMLEEFDLIIRNMKTMKEHIREMTMVTGFESHKYVGDTNIIKLKNQEIS